MNIGEERVPFRERISCTIPEACQATGLGRTKLYEEIAAGRVTTSKVGTRVLLSVQSLIALIEQSVVPPSTFKNHHLVRQGEELDGSIAITLETE